MYPVEVYQAIIHFSTVVILFGFTVLWFILSFIYPGKIVEDQLNGRYRLPSGYTILGILFTIANLVNTVLFFSCTLLQALVKLGYFV